MVIYINRTRCYATSRPRVCVKKKDTVNVHCTTYYMYIIDIIQILI